MILDKIVRLLEREILRGNTTEEYFFYITEKDMKDVKYYFLMNPSFDNRGRLQGQDGNYSFDYYNRKIILKEVANLENLVRMKTVIEQSLELTADVIVY